MRKNWSLFSQDLVITLSIDTFAMILGDEIHIEGRIMILLLIS